MAADKDKDKNLTEVEKADAAKADRAAKTQAEAQKTHQKLAEKQADVSAQSQSEALDVALEDADEPPDPQEAVAVQAALANEAPRTDIPVQYPVYEHPDPIKGYDVLDLTGPYNQAHSEQVGGFFRLVRKSDPNFGTDVITDAPFNTAHGPNRLTDTTRQLIEAAIDRLEALRKL